MACKEDLVRFYINDIKNGMLWTVEDGLRIGHINNLGIIGQSLLRKEIIIIDNPKDNVQVNLNVDLNTNLPILTVPVINDIP